MGPPGLGQDVPVRVQGEEDIWSPPACNALRAESGRGLLADPHDGGVTTSLALLPGCSGLRAQKDHSHSESFQWSWARGLLSGDQKDQKAHLPSLGLLVPWNLDTIPRKRRVALR